MKYLIPLFILALCCLSIDTNYYLITRIICDTPNPPDTRIEYSCTTSLTDTLIFISCEGPNVPPNKGQLCVSPSREGIEGSLLISRKVIWSYSGYRRPDIERFVDPFVVKDNQGKGHTLMSALLRW
jgi:hypothetical protein